MSKETLVGVAWAVGILVAMGGIFWYEAATFELNEYDVAFSTEQSTVDSVPGTLQVGQSATHTLEIPVGLLTNLTQIQLELTWVDDIGDPDTFVLEWDSQSESDQGTFNLSKGVLAVPTDTMVKALDDQDARQQMSGVQAEVNATLEVTVTLQSAPGETPGGVLEITPDGANDYSLSLVLTHYEGTFSKR